MLHVEVCTGDQPKLCVVWLHGLGADGHDFEPIVDELELPFAVRFIFPHAPVRPVTVNGGLPMRAWYDIFNLVGDPEDAAGIRASAAVVTELLDSERARGPESIVLAGFSQGGAIALHAGLRYERPLAGLLVLSSYLPLADDLAAEKAEANLAVPISMSHGSADTVVPEGLAERSCERLRSQGYRVEWHSYPMAHSVCAEQLRDLNDWLVTVMSSRRA